MALSFSHMEQLISLPEAAKALGMSESSLRNLVEQGKIKGAVLPGGEIVVSQDVSKIKVLNARLQEIDRKQFVHLENNFITLTQASDQYSIPNRTIRKWLNHGYLAADSSSYPVKVNEADLAYCALIYEERQKKGLQYGAPLLDENKQPYLLKHPGLSEYRQRKKRTVN